MSRARLIDLKLARNFVVSAYSCAIFGGICTLVVSVSGNYKAYGFDLFNLLDVLIFFAFAYGIYKRSRACAIGLFTYHLMNRIPMWKHTHSIELTFGGLAIPFAVIYFLGILGTFAYHSIKKEETDEKPGKALSSTKGTG